MPRINSPVSASSNYPPAIAGGPISRKASHDSCWELLLRGGRGRGRRDSGGHGLLSLRVVPFMVRRAGELLHALDAGRPTGHYRDRAWGGLPADPFQPAPPLRKAPP